MTSNTLSDAFALTRYTIDENLPPAVTETAGHEKLSEDFDKSRTNVIDLIKTAMESVKELSNLASQSQNPRFYEALTSAIKTAVEANKTLVADMHPAVREASNIKNNQLQPQQIQNNLFISTADLQDLLQGKDDVKTINQ